MDDNNFSTEEFSSNLILYFLSPHEGTAELNDQWDTAVQK